MFGLQETDLYWIKLAIKKEHVVFSEMPLDDSLFGSWFGLDNGDGRLQNESSVNFQPVEWMEWYLDGSSTLAWFPGIFMDVIIDWIWIHLMEPELHR